MSEDNETRRMTLDEIAVMREVVKWRKANGVEFFLNARKPFVAQGWASWSCHKTINGRLHKREVTWDRSQPEIGEVSDYHAHSFRWHEVGSVQQAIDVLVVYGYLPSRFSSAYRAGWWGRDSFSRSEADPDRDHDFYGDDERFPAVPAAW